MKRIAIPIIAALCISTQAAEIPDELIAHCAQIGGCVVIIPNGDVIPLALVQEQIRQIADDAFKAGQDAKTCKGKDV